MSWAYYNEHDTYAAQWLRNLISAGLIAPGWVDERSIVDVEPDELSVFTQCHFFAGIGVWSYALRLAGWPDDRPIWTGSCPCQPFSGAGKREGFADERHLWPVWFDLIRERRPGVVIGEQVASPDGLGWWDAVQDDLEGADYAGAALDLCVPGVGGPHIRQRLYWMANAKREASMRAERDASGPSSAAGGLDHTASTRCERTLENAEGEARNETRLRLSGEAGRTSGLVDAARIGHGTNDMEPVAGRRECATRPADGAHASGEPAACPVNGFWRAADWLFCRDGKWRPVEPEHVEMADGTAAAVGGVRAENDSEARMQTLLGTFGEEEVQQQAGGQWRFQEEEVLQPILHGGLDGRTDQGRQREEQQASIREDGEGRLRDVRQVGHEAFSSSPGRKSSQQSSVELTDIVRLLPLSLSLAELYGRRHDARELHLLRKTILQAGGLQHASKPMEAIWASLSEEEKNRIAMGFDASAWRRVVPFPLSSGEPNRVGRLRAYGNAIVATQASEFVEVVMEVLDDA